MISVDYFIAHDLTPGLWRLIVLEIIVAYPVVCQIAFMATSFVQVLFFLAAGIAVIILLTAKYRVHAFFALLIACFVVGLGVQLMISHANDAYFWVISKFSGLEMKAMLKSYSVATILMGLTTLLVVYVLSLLLL
jgi:H+/gluconate symporter-like permease